MLVNGFSEGNDIVFIQGNSDANVSDWDLMFQKQARG